MATLYTQPNMYLLLVATYSNSQPNQVGNLCRVIVKVEAVTAAQRQPQLSSHPTATHNTTTTLTPLLTNW